MTPLRRKTVDDMTIRRLAGNTIRSCILIVNLRNRAQLLTACAAGLRSSEFTQLWASDLDSGHSSSAYLRTSGTTMAARCLCRHRSLTL